MSDRLPYRATPLAALYESLPPLPAAVLLENVRSMYNVGSFFRTADAVGLERLLLAGITAFPPKKQITKTALGAEERVRWEHDWESLKLAKGLAAQGYELVAIETSPAAVDLFDWTPNWPVCVVFGHEVEGVSRSLLDLCERQIRIPMLGMKHSLNVATAGGVVLYELLRKFRKAHEGAR
jgi:tRNA G18 (ribose-2'-O)-methylase SpoU